MRVNRDTKLGWLLRAVPNTTCTRSPTKYVGAMVVGVCAFSSTSCDLGLVLAKWRCLVPPTSTPEGA